MANTKVTSRVLADDAVLTANITDANITTAKIAADAITGAKIADDAINSEHYTDGSIDTAHIADDQVTLAKMAGLARGKIIYGDSSGNPAALALGSNGQILKSDGTDISWGAESTFDTDAAQVFNESGAAVDFRIEGDTEQNLFFVDGSADKIGIGTSSPDAPLHITSNTPIIAFDESDASQVYRIGSFGGSFALYDSTDSAYRITVNGDGKVGIGTTSPAKPLHIYSADNQPLRIESSDAYAGIELKDNTSNASPPLISGVGNALVFYQHNGTDYAERMRLHSDGNVGIGTASPATTVGGSPVLDISGTVPSLRFTDTSAADLDWEWVANSGPLYLYAESTGTASISFLQDGKVGIGDTTPSYTLDVLSSSGTAASFRGEGGPYGMLIGGNDAGWGYLGSIEHAGYDLTFNANGYAHFGHGESTTFIYLGSQGGAYGGNSSHNLRASGGTFMYNSGSSNHVWEIGGVQRGYLDSSGWQDGSDASLKENIKDITYGLDTVKSLKPRNFDWKEVPAESKAGIGFIAQEVEGIIPEIISESRPDGEGTSIKGMNYGALTSVLTKAIQEQQTIIDDLKARIETLEG